MSDQRTGPTEEPEPAGTTERITRHLRNDEHPTTTEDPMSTMDPGTTDTADGTPTTELPTAARAATDRPGSERPTTGTGPSTWTTTPTTTPGAGQPGQPVAPPAANGVRVGTVVWGLVIAAIGVGLLAVAAGLVFDVELALIALVGAAGLALLVGSLAGGMRRRNR